MQQDEWDYNRKNPFASAASSVEVQPEIGGDGFEAEELRPFVTMWTRPRDTIRRIVAQDPRLHVVLLISLAGIGESLDRASGRSAGDQMPMAAIIGLACVLGPLGGLVSLWIGSHLIRISGDWLGGVAPREHLRAAMAWASMPAAFALPLWVPLFLLLGPELFTEEMPRVDAQPMLIIPLLTFGLVQIVLGGWGLVIFCKTVAEVQGFKSAWRGLGNILLASAIVVVPVVVIVLAVASLAPA